MTSGQIYIAVALVALALVALVAWRMGWSRLPGKPTPVAGLALLLVAAGVLFGESRVVGYALLGAGVTLAVADIWRKAST